MNTSLSARSRPARSGAAHGRRLAGGVLMAALVLVPTVLGGLWGTRHDARHAATVTVLLNPLEGNPFSPEGRDGLVNLETEARLVTSDATTRTVAQQVGMTPQGVATGVEVTVPVNTQLVRITVTRRDPAAAQELANAYASAYLDQRRDRTASTLEARRRTVSDELAAMREQLGELTAKRAAKGTSPQQQILLDQQISGLAAQMASAQSEKTSLGYVSTDPGQVVTPALASSPGPIPSVVWGAGSGALAGMAAVWGLRRLRTRRGDLLLTSADLRARGQEPVGPARTAELVDTLRARLLVEVPQRPAVVLVADVGETDRGAAHLARELVESLAAAQLRSVLIVLDERWAPRRELAARRSPSGPGLVEVAHGQARLEEVLRRWGPTESAEPDELPQEAEGPGTSGARPGGATWLPPGDVSHLGSWGDLVASPQFVAVLKSARECSEVVVISGVTLPSPDGQLLCGLVDAVTLRVVAARSTGDALDGAVSVVRESQARHLATLLDEPGRTPGAGRVQR